MLKKTKILFSFILPFLLFSSFLGYKIYENISISSNVSEKLKKIENLQVKNVNLEKLNFKQKFSTLNNTEFLNQNFVGKSFASNIITFNQLSKSILALESQIYFLQNAKNKRLKLSDTNLILFKKYSALYSSFNINLVPNHLRDEVQQVFTNKITKQNLQEINKSINNSIIYLRRAQFEKINIEQLLKISDKNTFNFSKIKSLLITDIGNSLLLEKNKNDKKSLILFTLLTISLICFIISIILSFVSKPKKVDIKSEIIDIYKAFGKRIILKTDEEAAEALSSILPELEKKSKEQAKEKEDNISKNEFLANMSHEIRTPLNGIMGFIDLLKNSPLNENQKEFLDIIEKSSTTLLELINNILDISKINNNKTTIEPVIFNPISHFENAIEIYGPKAAEKNIDLNFFMDPSLGNLNLIGDVTKIKEVLVNFMSNAVKFTPENGQIDVNIIKKTSLNNKTLIFFSIKDTGSGIPKNKHSKIFEAFEQASSSVTREFGGTGLGLSISFKFIELLGGNLELNSDENIGTEFYFTLEFENSSVNESLENTFKPLNIAIYSPIDYNRENYLTRYINYYGASIFEFKSFLDLKNLLSKQRIDRTIFNIDTLIDTEIIQLIEFVGQNKLKIDLLMKASNRKRVDNLNIPYTKIIFEPLQNSKVHSLLVNIEKNKNVASTTKQTLEDKSISQEEIKIKEETSSVILGETKKAEVNTIKKVRALIAEDNLINQKLIKRTLESFDFEVEIANNGLEALNMRKEAKYDIIFMDIVMPEMSGLESTKEILSWEKEYNEAHIPIIALTANSVAGDRKRFMEEGMDEYTTKPLKKQEIVNILNKFLNLDINL